MIELRNPFRIRASEHIEADATFLRLFSPDVLDLLPESEVWDRIQFFQSAPGGGKTSLFRVFSPTVLRTLYASRNTEQRYKDLYQRLRSLGALDDKTGPSILGVMISCARNYASLNDLLFDEGRKERLLFALLNARLVMAALRGALALRGLEFPADLSKINVEVPENTEVPARVPLPADGEALFHWARSVEAKVFGLIDSFGPPSFDVLEGHDVLFALDLLSPAVMRCGGHPIATKSLLMLDDLHKLTSQQRAKVVASLAAQRPSVGVWIAERLEALDPEELINPGSIEGREYASPPIILEEFWNQRSARFERAVVDIASRRVKLSRDVYMADTFENCLQNTLDGGEWRHAFSRAAEAVRHRLEGKLASGGLSHRFKEWLQAKDTHYVTDSERAVSWRSLEILVERDLRQSQQSLNFPEPLPEEYLDKKESSSVRGAAEFFLAQEFDIPYYYGISRLALLASSNIEQFLAFASPLFEEVVSTELLKGQLVALSPERQQQILTKNAKQRWDEIPRRVPYGRDVQRLLESIALFSRDETLRPNAPYAPGVTGFGLKTSDKANLIKKSTYRENPVHTRLVRVISACLSHNLLDARLGKRQGQRGQTWTLFYLNRWLCVHFNLPLQFGGWRPQRVVTLDRWLNEGHRPRLPRNGLL